MSDEPPRVERHTAHPFEHAELNRRCASGLTALGAQLIRRIPEALFQRVGCGVFSVGATQRMKSSGSGRFQNLDLAVELARDGVLRDLQVVMRLQVHPELCLHAEELPEP